MRSFFLLTFGLTFAISQATYAQTNAARVSEFEVATVKPIDPDKPHTVGVRIYPGGRVVVSGMGLKGLIHIAFGLSFWQLSGGEAWMDKDSYDVEAKPPKEAQSSITNLRYTNFDIDDRGLREMLQALLIDRFQLKFHRDTKTGDVYRLEKSGKPIRLHPSPTLTGDADPTGNYNSFSSIGYVGGQWGIFHTTMPQFAKFAGDIVLHAPVIDRTGLSGLFDYRQTTPVSDEEAKNTDHDGSFLRLIPELGLKLEREKGPIEAFVIDHAEKPSSN